MGLPTVGQVGAGNTISHCAFFTRAYNLIWNEWFRDENFQNSVVVDKGDGPDANASTNYTLLRRGKRHDYFTSSLPWPQKGGTSVTIPIGTSAPVKSGSTVQNVTGWPAVQMREISNNANPGIALFGSNTGTFLAHNGVLGTNQRDIAPLTFMLTSSATAATINQLRQSFQIQKLLERDARGGTRYTEIVRAHFGVISPDARLQRPEYLGGGSSL